jgi:hypothetical protein
VYDLPGGRTQVIGTLVREDDLEGGFWAISPRRPDMGSDVQPIVLANPEIFTQPPLESLEGAFVVAEGTLSDGPSIRMAGPELVADNLSRIESVRTSPSGQRALRGVPPRWARIEKPGFQRLPNGQMRFVGVLGFAKSTDSSATSSWVVLNQMPFGSGGTAQTSAVLSEGPFGDPADSTWLSAYAAIVGDVVGTMGTASGVVPVIRVTDAEVVTKQETTADEVID